MKIILIILLLSAPVFADELDPYIYVYTDPATDTVIAIQPDPIEIVDVEAPDIYDDGTLTVIELDENFNPVEP